MPEEIITHSAEETIQWGREFVKRLKAPILVLLTGDLGSGKTTLTKGLVSGLGAAHENDVTSPTFTLVHVYGKQAKVYHADLYRIESFHDFETLGLEDLFAAPAVAILEWSEKFPLPSPWPTARVRLEHLGGDSRRISVLGPSCPTPEPLSVSISANYLVTPVLCVSCPALVRLLLWEKPCG